MTTSLVTLLSYVLVLVGMAGVVLPVLPGLVLAFAGLLLYYFFGQADYPLWLLVIFGLLTALSAYLSYAIPAKSTLRYGGSRKGSIGGLAGTLAGLFFPPVGFLIGLVVGTVLGELLETPSDRPRAFRAAKGAIFGFLKSSGISLLIGGCMLLSLLFYTFF